MYRSVLKNSRSSRLSLEMLSNVFTAAVRYVYIVQQPGNSYEVNGRGVITHFIQIFSSFITNLKDFRNVSKWWIQEAILGGMQKLNNFY